LSARGRRLAALLLFDIAAVTAVAGLFGLAAWQMQRRAWKLDLIARVEARAFAEPVPAPGPERWPALSAAADEYRRVRVAGRWLSQSPAFVQAVTEHGGGYWVMSPLLAEGGATIFVNRGFVPRDRRSAESWRPEAERASEIVGLLRFPEKAGLLRANDPAADRWYARDVDAIAASRGLGPVAPYFIDRERQPGEVGLPIAGLTVLRFTNNHLIYALTWGALALMAAAGAVAVNVDALRRRRARAEA
jgi:surfeit locus 1 family protein